MKESPFKYSSARPPPGEFWLRGKSWQGTNWQVKTSICLIRTSRKYEKVPVRGEHLCFGSKCKNVSLVTALVLASAEDR